MICLLLLGYCLFQNVIQLELYRLWPFQIDLFSSAIYIEDSPMSFWSLLSSFPFSTGPVTVWCWVEDPARWVSTFLGDPPGPGRTQLDIAKWGEVEGTGTAVRGARLLLKPTQNG